MRYLYFLGFCCLCLSGFAHGDIHARIEALNFEIKKHRDSINLYFERGELLLIHGDYRAALKDLKRCEKKEVNDRLYFLIAKVYHQLGSFDKCDRYLQRVFNPDFFDPSIYHLSALNSECKRDFENAAVIYRKIIDSARFVRPEFYLDLSNLYILQNKPELAIRVLNDGINKKGYLPVFYQPLVALYEQTEDYASAIAVMDHVVDLSNRKEFALYQRAILLKKFGSDSACKMDLNHALLLIQALPSPIQNQSAIKDLKSDILRRSDVSLFDQTQP